MEGDRRSGTTGDAMPAPKQEPKLLSKLEMIDMARQHFCQLDADGNGFLTEKELAREVENPANKGQIAQTIAALYGMNSRLDFSQDKDASFGVFAGITKADLDKTEEIIKAKQSQASENTVSVEYLDALDTNKDGKLDKEEIEGALKKGGLPDQEKELFEYFSKNAEAENPLRISDVLHYLFSKELGDKEDAVLNRMDFLMRHCWENQIDEPKLFALGKPDDGIGLHGVQQGTLGDCYFLSSLAAVACMTPDTIKNMITENKDGTYTVTFPGAKSEPVTVSAPTEAERGLYNGASENGIWGSVMEKAYGAYCHKHFWRRTPLNWGGGLTTTEGADGGGVFLGKLMTLLTGKDADQDWQLFTFDSTTKRKLMEHVGGEEKVPVVAWQKFFHKTNVSGVENHVYSVVNFDPKGEEGGTVTLYNPWGHKESITFKQFSKRFVAVAYRDK